VRGRRRLLAEADGVSEIWPSFTDVMSTMALILFVLVLLSYVRSLVNAKRLEGLEHQIGASKVELARLRDQIRTGQTELAASRAELRGQQAIVADSNRQLDALRSQLQSIAVVRVSVLERVKQALEAELGPTAPNGQALVTLGETGNVVLNESLVFEFGSYAIKKEARPLLDTLAKALGNVLSDDAIRPNIDTVVIEGHTDERGSASANWDLSTRRATAVLEYLLQANPRLADSYGGYFAASGHSKYRPLDSAATEDAYQKNRRIEIAVIPRDENVRKVLDDYTKSGPAPSQ
jgi:chemotaxis protein MotB